MTERWEILELRLLSKRLEEALNGESDYQIGSAAQSMQFYAEMINPERKRMYATAEHLCKLTKDLVSAMDSIDTSAIESFVRLGRDLD